MLCAIALLSKSIKTLTRTLKMFYYLKLDVVTEYAQGLIIEQGVKVKFK